ncbi:hypothetical protein BBROOKSOX_1477 [Bathymodiolus brooksi thiotrophic gill symbiont]|nr:hypothetical protein BBROOKSOX_1477 [Bathymodiolus brooksi thiotrophic gill symbiont]
MGLGITSNISCSNNNIICLARNHSRSSFISYNTRVFINVKFVRLVNCIFNISITIANISIINGNVLANNTHTCRNTGKDWSNGINNNICSNITGNSSGCHNITSNICWRHRSINGKTANTKTAITLRRFNCVSTC